MCNPCVVVCRIGKKICGWDRVGGPDHLTSFEVPPHIGIIEPLSNRQHSEHDQKTGQHYRE